MSKWTFIVENRWRAFIEGEIATNPVKHLTRQEIIEIYGGNRVKKRGRPRK